MKVRTYIEFTGKEVYFLRMVLKMSQKQLGDLLHCSVPLICLIECGERKITPDMSINLVELLKTKGNYDPDKDGSESDFIQKLLDFWN